MSKISEDQVQLVVALSNAAAVLAQHVPGSHKTVSLLLGQIENVLPVMEEVGVKETGAPVDHGEATKINDPEYDASIANLALQADVSYIWLQGRISLLNDPNTEKTQKLAIVQQLARRGIIALPTL